MTVTVAVAAPAFPTTFAENDILDWFWPWVSDYTHDRLDVLRVLARVPVDRPPTWDYQAERDKDTWQVPGCESPSQCFVCFNGDRRLCWHHVLTVDNGGSTTRRNLVSVCLPCHQDIHDFTITGSTAEKSRSTRRRREWTHIGGTL